MKQKFLVIIPVLAFSFLASCNKGGESTPEVTHTVTFDSKGGSYTPDSQVVKDGELVSEPDEPTKDNFNFGGWYTDEAAIECKYDFSRPVISDLKLYAKWDNFVTVTFDAKNGLFENTSRYVSFSVPLGAKLYPYINAMKDCEPISNIKNEIFACYSYKDNDDVTIDYNDVVKSDITLEANYLPADDHHAPYHDLEQFNWNFIKQVAVTKKEISKVFAIGAIKSVKLYNQYHVVRIIDFNHDCTDIDKPDETKVGLTFEFQNLITKENGEVYYTVWNPEPVGGEPYNRFITSNLNTLLNGGEGYEGDCILDNLPSDLTKVMQLVEKQVGKGGSKVYDSEPYTAKLFPLARAEMMNSHIGQEPLDEGTQYEYYKGHDGYGDTIRLKAGVGKKVETDSKEYWLRSPYCQDYDIYTPDDVFKVCNGTGNLINGSMFGTNHGFAPAFCI